MRRHLLTALALAVAVIGVLVLTRIQREREYQLHILDGDRALARNDISAAIEAFSGASSLKPDAMLAYLKRGDAYRRRGEGETDLELAQRDLRTAATIDSTAPGPQEGLGDVYLARQYYSRAIEHYRASLQLDERSARVQYKLGLAFYRAEQPEAALRATQQAIQIDGRLAAAHYLKGLCLVAVRRLPDAHKELQQALSIDPTMTAAREELADVCHQLGHTNEAISQLAALVKAEPHRADRPIALGAAYSHAGRTDMAVDTLSRAADEFPRNSQVFIALARVWLEHAVATGDQVAIQKGLEASRQAGTAGTFDRSLMTLTGLAWMKVHEPRRALRLFEQATAELPVEPVAYAHLADAAEQLGMWTVARNALRRADALAGDEASSATSRTRLLRLGNLSMKIGDFEDARRSFLRARQGPNDLLAANRLAAAEQAIAKESPLDLPTQDR